MGHRGGNYVGMGFAGAPGAAPDLAAKPIDPRHFSGFSHLLGAPDEASRSVIGADPAKAREILEALYSLLPIAANVDNPRIPSGYTYLLQFIAHDLVDTTVPFWAAAEAGIPSRNMRDQALVLDTLYGGGPTVCPIAFAPNGAMVDYRTELRLGRIGDAAGLGLTTGQCPYRDLARLKPGDGPAPGNLDDAAQVYVADARSDDNTLLSQIVVLFSIVHNAIARKLAGRIGPQAAFAHASSATLAMYHAIIRQDAMKRLLDDRVYAALNARPASSSDWLWSGDGVPVEFSQGAFRVGHAMVRPFYRFNTVNTFAVGEMLGGPVLGDPVRDPLPSIWIVEWSRFFETGDVTPNYSLKLAIHQQIPLDFPDMFTPVAANTPGQMTLRDWLSAANARMWRLDALIDAARARYPGLTFLDGPAIETWLTGLMQRCVGLDTAKATVGQNIALLKSDLPLPLYVLLEAQLDPAIAGAHLGPLGSVIVGETIFRRLTMEEEKLAGLIPAARQALGAEWDKIQSVASMPDLVRLAEDWGDLGNCPQLPFIAP